MEVIDAKTAWRYKKQCGTGTRWTNRLIEGKQQWVSEDPLTETELARQLEDLEKYWAVTTRNPTDIAHSNQWLANLRFNQRKLQDTQEAQGEVQEALAKEQKRQAEVQEALAKEQRLHAGTLDAHAEEMHEHGQQ